MLEPRKLEKANGGHLKVEGQNLNAKIVSVSSEIQQGLDTVATLPLGWHRADSGTASRVALEVRQSGEIHLPEYSNQYLRVDIVTNSVPIELRIGISLISRKPIQLNGVLVVFGYSFAIEVLQTKVALLLRISLLSRQSFPLDCGYACAFVAY